MKLSFIYDQGSSKHHEDGTILSHPFYGVLDGVSEPYSPSHPPRIFNGGMSGGAFVSRIVERQFARMSPLFSAHQAVLEANKAVWRKQRRRGVALDGGQLAGASFAVIKIDGDWIHVVQGCDAFVLWAMKDGSIGMTETQNKASEIFLNNKVVEIMREIAGERSLDLEVVDDETRDGIRAEMWNRFYPILVETRSKYVNNPRLLGGYGLLNGQTELERKWSDLLLPRSKVDTILLFTDGMVPWWGSLEGLTLGEIAGQVFATYRAGGLAGLLARARGMEVTTRAISYMDAAEATAIAIEF